ncbi:MAG TPA: ATP-binding cassette domain-containing protein, partial [Beijerinckiaceae bacterium]|nr:ATP-binding cassette domain-containing protein [Beijerinckiaceae bacterium]
MTARAARAELAPAGGESPRYLEVAGVTKRFGPSVVLKDLSLAVAQAEFVSLLGPSGCGKTTLLRLVAGLLAPDAGSISIGGRDFTRVAAHRRNIGV